MAGARGGIRGAGAGVRAGGSAAVRHGPSRGDDRPTRTSHVGNHLSCADEVAADVLLRTPGRPSLSGAGETSPSLTIRLPAASRARLDALAARDERRASEIVRDALDEYLARHAG
ncbi:CopG family ribbon-helix-helix protein [Pengzhenrongella sp.]|uniref:CopG family ribbon-helix-helix protein n=1 Tax=Pengzhenrongella sp. TaxID=2888820 RepID=UPI0039C97E54